MILYFSLLLFMFKAHAMRKTSSLVHLSLYSNLYACALVR